MKHTRNYKVIRYAKDHIHLVQRHGDDLREQCFLSRNWNRCTAEKCSFAQYRAGALDGQNRSFWNGDAWVKAELREEPY